MRMMLCGKFPKDNKDSFQKGSDKTRKYALFLFGVTNMRGTQAFGGIIGKLYYCANSKSN